ncbi:hypothetical protein AVEN_223904-1 [Araneus ventricosus]|uniref:Uncharacterized protein n=1 Tax=Araneus ventricosus TaxID=182803 RepID=A0A4Y2JAB7_ARAVE|nr:hypothetical protein AVEN_223904-1 [Araneus ventricosus]
MSKSEKKRLSVKLSFEPCLVHPIPHNIKPTIQAKRRRHKLDEIWTCRICKKYKEVLPPPLYRKLKFDTKQTTKCNFSLYMLVSILRTELGVLEGGEGKPQMCFFSAFIIFIIPVRLGEILEEERKKDVFK